MISETLHKELAAKGSRVGVTVLCPAFFPTGITNSERVRPPGLASPASEADRDVQEKLDAAVRKGRLSADDVAALAMEAVSAGELYCFTHKKIRLAIEERLRHVLAACPYPVRP